MSQLNFSRFLRRQITLLAGGLLLASAAQAQDVAANVAIPFYTSTHAVQGLYGHWFKPQAEAASQAAQTLTSQVDAYCTGTGAGPATLESARQAYQQASNSWRRLSSVAIGPLVERRSSRLIDFQPLRPALLKKAILAQPKDLGALERIGAPAKGFPALEELLWKQVAAPNTPACAYAQLVAAEIAAEIAVLDTGYGELASKDWGDDSEATTETMGEFINQWLGGLERLRWLDMEKPLRSAGNKPPELTRMHSDGTLQAWKAHWQGLRELAIRTDRSVPTAGEDLVPLETYLRGRGLKPLADEWLQAVNAADAAMASLDQLDLASVEAAAKPLSALKRLMQTKVAKALEVNIGFSDADGD